MLASWQEFVSFQFVLTMRDLMLTGLKPLIQTQLDMDKNHITIKEISLELKGSETEDCT